MKLFIPNMYIEKYNKLNIDRLLDLSIKTIICDIDNTLVSHDEEIPNEEVIEFVAQLKKYFNVILVSNNTNSRVSLFASKLDVKYYSFALKPFKYTYKKILRDCNCNINEIAVIGDQILTDIIGGNRMKFYTILSTQLVVKDLKWTKVNRVLENLVFIYLEKRKLFVRGKYYE